MDYVEARDRQQEEMLQKHILAFLHRHRNLPDGGSRKTVIVFPGGLGSQLDRATKRIGAGPEYRFTEHWLNCSVVFGAVNKLRMDGDIDLGRRFVVADGPLDFALVDLRPYEAFEDWCTAQGLNWFVFGWDWRRPAQYTADFFLNRFLPMFRDEVRNKAGFDPLDDLHIVGHSFGGLVAKLLLHDPASEVGEFKSVTSVGTPFYGHGDNLHRYFVGDHDLNQLSWVYSAVDTTRVTSSFLGTYALQWLDRELWERDGHVLAASTFPMPRYPCMDAGDPSQIADPYLPVDSGARTRYPTDFGFDIAELSRARETLHKFAAPIPADREHLLHCVRGIQDHGGCAAQGTIYEQRWSLVGPSYDPNAGQTPIEDYSTCPGDGLIPACSARPVSVLSENVHDVRGEIDDEFEHVDLLAYSSVQSVLAPIFGLPVARAPQTTPAPKKAATYTEARAFLEGLEGMTARKLFEKMEESKPHIRRLWLDLLKSPTRKTGSLPDRVGAREYPEGDPRNDECESTAEGPKPEN